ncbi:MULTISPECIES: hypothetical protein [Streptomyces]|uniref:hypothetical protein n=1 Tax=Streptomyces TaxID=1883 RepID=UPI0006EB877C|nr:MULTISPECIES: hypothetical protein [Streptomyces]
MAYADDGLAKLFARHRNQAPRRERQSVREAVQRISAQLDLLYDHWLAQADAPSQERGQAVHEALGAVRTAVTHTLYSVRPGSAPPYEGPSTHEPYPSGQRARGERPSNPFARLFRAEAEPPPPAWPPPPAPRPEVSVERLLDAVGHALEAVDRSFQSLAAEPAPAPAWHEDDDLVDVLHGLLAAEERRSAELALARISSLRDKLRLQRGIEVLGYDPHDSLHDTVLFEFSAPAAPGLPGRCRAPALVRGTRVLRRGVVLPLPSAERLLPPPAEHPLPPPEEG